MDFDAVAVVRQIVGSSDVMTIATADKSGKPWISPVGFVADEKFNLYWVSSHKANHSQHIKDRPEVSISILGHDAQENLDGVYFEAVASELSDVEEINRAIELRAASEPETRFIIDSEEDVTGDSIWRIYKAEPVAVYKRSDAFDEGQAVTIRLPIDLNELIAES